MTALRKPIDAESGLADAIVDRIGSLTENSLIQLGAWQGLADLSTRTEFEAIGADKASVVLDGHRFEAVADVYVLLNYGTGDDEQSLSDSYVATIRGTIDGSSVAIDDVTVDTSPFYD